MADIDVWRIRSGDWTLWKPTREQLQERLRTAWDRLEGYSDPETELNPDVREAADYYRQTLRGFAAQWKDGDLTFTLSPIQAIGFCSLLRLTNGVLRYAAGPSPLPDLVIEHSSIWYTPETLLLDPRRSAAEILAAEAEVLREERSRRDAYGRIPAHIAAANGLPIIQMKEFTEPDIFLDVVDQFGFTPLGYAIRSQSTPTVRAILRGGADANNAGPAMKHPLFHTNEFSMTEALLEFDADPNAQDPDTGDTPLHAVARQLPDDTLDHLRLFVRHGGRLTLPNTAGETPLDLLSGSPYLREALRLFERAGRVKRDVDE